MFAHLSPTISKFLFGFSSTCTKTALAGALFLSVTVAAAPVVAAPTVYSVDTAHSRIGFVSYTDLFDCEGKFSKWSAVAQIDAKNITQSTLVLVVEISSVDTDNEMRNQHLQKEEFFYTEKYPQATFVSKKVTYKDDKQENGMGNVLMVVGDLTMRGVTQEITVPVTVTQIPRKDMTVIRAKAKMSINRRDFGINYTSPPLLPMVQDNVDIVFDINFQPAPPAAPQP